MKRYSILAALLLAGCASSGPQDAALTGSDPSQVHLIIKRPGLLYAAESASVAVDGAPACRLMAYGSCAVNVPAGPVAVSATLSLEFGTSTLAWNGLPGQTYVVQLKSHGIAAALGGAVLGGALGPVGAMAGAYAGEAAQDGNGGPLKIVLAAQ